MTVLDAYAVIAYLRAERAAGEVERLLLAGDAGLTAVGVGEVLDHLVRVIGADEEDVTLDLAQLGLLDAIPVDSAIGAGAGRLRARHYSSRTRSISMADCVAAEAARVRGEPVATSDPHLLDVCHLERIAYVALPGSTHPQWEPPGE